MKKLGMRSNTPVCRNQLSEENSQNGVKTNFLGEI